MMMDIEEIMKNFKLSRQRLVLLEWLI